MRSEDSGENGLNVLILGLLRPKNIEYLVRELLAQNPLTNIFVSLDILRDSDSRYSLNRECLKVVSKLYASGLIRSYQVSVAPLGCYRGVVNGIDWFFKEAEYGLILEEDLIVHSRIVEIGLEMKHLFKSDLNLGSISFFAPEVNCEDEDTTRFFPCAFPSSWGWMTTHERWDKFIHDANKIKLARISKGGINGYRRWKEVQERIENGSLDSWAYRWMFTHWVNGWHTLTPFPKGFIQNMGFDELATHTKRRDSEKPKGLFAEKWELESKDIKITKMSRKIEKLILMQRFGVGSVFNSLKRKLL